MINAKTRLLAALLASTTFFVVSCTGISIVAGKVLVNNDARDIIAGDQPHNMFHVLAVTDGELKPVLLRDLEAMLQRVPEVSFHVKPGRVDSPGYRAGVDNGQTHYSYFAEGDETLSVELDVTDFDHFRGTYHYTVTRNTVSPVYSHQNLFLKTALTAIKFGIGLALILNFSGKGLRWHINRRRPGNRSLEDPIVSSADS